ncbi:hypothetical protein Dimus_012199 [Dionaea muscipula]
MHIQSSGYIDSFLNLDVSLPQTAPQQRSSASSTLGTSSPTSIWGVQSRCGDTWTWKALLKVRSAMLTFMTQHDSGCTEFLGKRQYRLKAAGYLALRGPRDRVPWAKCGFFTELNFPPADGPETERNQRIFEHQIPGVEVVIRKILELVDAVVVVWIVCLAWTESCSMWLGSDRLFFVLLFTAAATLELEADEGSKSTALILYRD